MCLLFGFSFQEFLLCLLYCLKMAFICEFQHTPLCKMAFSQGFICLVGMRFCGHVPNSYGNKNLESINPLLYKMVFLVPKTLLCCSSMGKKTYFLTLNVKILQIGMK